MTWIKMDDRYPDHPKVAGLTDGAYRLWTTSIAYCSQHQTDGMVPEPIITRWGVRHADRAASELVSGGLWRSSADGYEVVNYLKWQRSREEIDSLSSVRSEAGKRGARAKQLAKQLAKQAAGSPQAEAEAESETDPGSTYDDFTPSSGSSWSDDELFTEAGRVVARCTTKPLDDFDNYATGASMKIRRERGHLVASLRAKGYDLPRAAFVLAQRDADLALSTIEPPDTSGLDADFSPSSGSPKGAE